MRRQVRGGSLAVVQNPSADRCLAVQLAAPFVMKAAPSTSVRGSDLPGAAAQSDQRSPGPARTGPLRNLMNAMAPTRPTEMHGCRVRLSTGPAAPAEGRRQVRAAICAWDIPVDPDVAVLLTSELVTNAVRHEPGETVTLAVTSSRGQLRVDVGQVGRLPHPCRQGRVLHACVPARACRGRRTRPARDTNVGTVSHTPPAPHRPHRTACDPAPGSPRRDGAQ